MVVTEFDRSQNNRTVMGCKDQGELSLGLLDETDKNLI